MNLMQPRTVCPGLWLSLGLLLAGPVQAQEVTLEPSATQRCLTPVAERRGAPDYPLRALKAETPGRVKVELVFDSADRGPEVTVLEQEGDDTFVAAVKAHVRDYRVPCLGGREAPARLRIDFVFTPDMRRVLWSTPTDANSEQRKALLKCLRHESGEKAPIFPESARKAGVQGRVLARMRFTAPDQAPAIEVFSRPQARLLARAISAWTQGYRMPCFSGEPLDTTWVFYFIFEGESYGFKGPMTLQQLLPAVRGIHTQTLNFDFTEMACPFDVRLSYRRPELPNVVGELAPEGTSAAASISPNPTRRQFVDWLTTIELDVPPSALDSVFGDSVTLTIPCIKINLNPKE